MPEEFEKVTMAGYFELVIKENSGREITLW